MKKSKYAAGILPYSRREWFYAYIKPIIELFTDYLYKDAWTKYNSEDVKIKHIIDLLLSSSLVVIDIAEKNPNVFFEFGIIYIKNLPMVLICERTNFDKIWKGKAPFDIQGRELVIYNESKIYQTIDSIRDAILDTIYIMEEVTLTWTNLYGNARNIIKTNDKIGIKTDGIILSENRIEGRFILKFHVRVVKTYGGGNPDLRLIITNDIDEGFIGIVFPWQNEGEDPNRLECHFNYYNDSPIVQKWPNHENLQIGSMCEKDESKNLEFDVIFSYNSPNIIYEASIFDDEHKRIVISEERLCDRGYDLLGKVYIGFRSINAVIDISNIKAKTIKHKNRRTKTK